MEGHVVIRVLTLGTFDIPHAGHAAFLNRAAAFGDELLVGVNTDEFVTEYKGTAPLFTYEERVRMIYRLGWQVVKNDSAGYDCISKHLPDRLVVGSDWATKNYHAQIGMSQLELDAINCSLVFVPYSTGISTTEIKKRCRA